MDLSVVVPTYRGIGRIDGLIRSLSDQTDQEFQVVIVVDGPQEREVEHIKNRASKLNLKIHQQANQGRAVARNTGASLAEGELLVFFDDDMRPEQHAIEKHKKFHDKIDDSILVGQQVAQESDDFSLIQKFKKHCEITWSSKLGTDLRRVSKNDPYITAAHMSVSKKIFDQLGGFDSRLKDTEDYDLALRATLEDIAIYSDQSIVASHDDRVTCRSYIRRRRQYYEANKFLLSLKPDLVSQFRRSLSTQDKRTVRQAIYAALSNKFWVDAIDNEVSWLRMMPIRLRYKFIDAVIYALSHEYPDREV